MASLFFIMGKTFTTESDSPSLVLPVLYNNEIAVGSYLMVKVVKRGVVKIATFICLNASQSTTLPKDYVMNNLFWFEITDLGFNLLRAE